MAQTIQVAVRDKGGKPTSDNVMLPNVFNTPIRPDLVQFVHTQMRKNARQSYGVKIHHGPSGIVAGHQHSAHSWGTGRAVSRIPRVSGGGTHRAGQGAFGNMCRSGRMFAPNRIWRKWHRKINLKQRRYAVASAIAASSSAPLVMARGHRIESVGEIPLVVDFTEVKKTSDAVKMLKDLGLGEELERCQKQSTRAGKGKYRRGKKSRKGPLIVHACDSVADVVGFKNLRGVQTCHVDRLNLLQLAPGGHIGRLVVWSKDAMNKLGEVYKNKENTNFHIPKNVMENSDVTGNLRKRSLPASLGAVFDKVVLEQAVQSKLREQAPQLKGKRKKVKLNTAKYNATLYAN